MQHFSGLDYIKIDIANAYGLDKELFETRIKWVDDRLDTIEDYTNKADEPPIFYAGCMALRKALKGEATGYMVGLDACSSGLQIMGAIVGCLKTCSNTGLIDPTTRSDIYTNSQTIMNSKVAANVSVPRKDIKQAVMTFFYGSTAEPEKLFGEGDILDAFYETMAEIAPGGEEIRNALIDCWQPTALVHQWQLPDGFDAKVKVMATDDKRVELEIDEFKTTFTYRFKENRPVDFGVSLAANVIHSIDGMIVREMNRRCNYEMYTDLMHWMWKHIDDMNIPVFVKPDHSRFISLANIIDYAEERIEFTDGQLLAMQELIERTFMRSKPFPIVCIHDAFKCHANNMNVLRQVYVDIFVDLACSNILEDLLQQVTGDTDITVTKEQHVDHLIANANYALS